MILSRAISRQAFPRPPQAGRLNPTLAQYSNTEPLFGKNSLEFTSNDGVPAFFRFGRANLFPSASSNFGQGTIEFWFYPTAGTSLSRQLFRITEVATAITIFTAAGNVVFARYHLTPGVTLTQTSGYSYNLNQWNHIAVTLDDNRFLTLWLNGERKQTLGDGTNTLVTSGGSTYGLWGGLFNGLSYRREFRVSKSVRYDKAIATYDVPTGPFVNDADTYMLFHMDGSDENAAGINQLMDDVSIQLPVIAPITATGGDILEYEEGGEFYRSHTFNSSGTFEVTALAEDSAFDELDYLIVAGGGGGGFEFGGGGGAGGMLVDSLTATLGTFAIAVGAGGTGVSVRADGSSGTNSSAFSISAIAGGGGGGFQRVGLDGGSGGGGGGRSSAVGGAGTSGQGFVGGTAGGTSFTRVDPGGGGGGASEVGVTPITAKGGNGGDGLANTFKDGISTFYAGGGGGGVDGRGNAEPSDRGFGGLGGGGDGVGFADIFATAGEPNTGGGGGGGGASALVGESGGSGIVIVRYKIPQLT